MHRNRFTIKPLGRASRANLGAIGNQLGKRLHGAPPRGIISPVNASLPLDQMSTEGKLAALEAIWAISPGTSNSFLSL